MALGEVKVLALVPARGGSKHLPGKNLQLAGGRSLVEITLRAAQAARAVDAVYLSSDSPEILAVGTAVGAALVQRPAEFASDTASAIDVVRHFLSVLPPDLSTGDPYILYLQPTSPLRTARHIDEALAALAGQGGRAVMSVVELAKSPYKSFRLDADQRLQSLFDEALSNYRRQDLPRTFSPNGAIYAFRASDFLARQGFPSNGSVPYVMSEADSLDIDTARDLEQLNQHHAIPRA